MQCALTCCSVCRSICRRMVCFDMQQHKAVFDKSTLHLKQCTSGKRCYSVNPSWTKQNFQLDPCQAVPGRPQQPSSCSSKAVLTPNRIREFTWVLVELSQEGLSSLILAHLSKLEGDCSWSIRRVLAQVLGLLYDLGNSLLGLTSGLTICASQSSCLGRHWVARAIQPDNIQLILYI